MLGYNKVVTGSIGSSIDDSMRPGDPTKLGCKITINHQSILMIPKHPRVDFLFIMEEQKLEKQLEKQLEENQIIPITETTHQAAHRQCREFSAHGYRKCDECKWPRFLCHCVTDKETTLCKCYDTKQCYYFPDDEDEYYCSYEYDMVYKCKQCGNETTCEINHPLCKKSCDCYTICIGCHLPKYECMCRDEYYDNMFDGVQSNYDIDDFKTKREVLRSEIPAYILLEQRCFTMPLYDHIRLRTNIDLELYKNYMHQIVIVINYGFLPNDIIEYMLEFVDPDKDSIAKHQRHLYLCSDWDSDSDSDWDSDWDSDLDD